jgi:hypothetical protein
VDLGGLAALAGGGMPVAMDAMNGCCTPANQCGLDGALFGQGCVENAAVDSMLSGIPFIGGLITVPAPRACDAEPTEPEADGGSEEDAG